MGILISRKLSFDSGHRLFEHEGKCQYLHGHRYTATIFAESNAGLDSIGRVVDFGVIKKVVGSWIDTNWDHNLLLSTKDRECGEVVKKWCKNGAPYYIPGNPTAELLASYLLQKAAYLLQEYPIRVLKITLDETPNCSAEVEGEGA